jgi:hypothetical protein
VVEAHRLEGSTLLRRHPWVGEVSIQAHLLIHSLRGMPRVRCLARFPSAPHIPDGGVGGGTDGPVNVHAEGRELAPLQHMWFPVSTAARASAHLRETVDGPPTFRAGHCTVIGGHRRRCRTVMSDVTPITRSKVDFIRFSAGTPAFVV